jgi:hypothetical protein
MILLLVLFGVPLLLSFVLYYATSWRPRGLSNHGELFMPTIVMNEALQNDAAEVLKSGKWSLLVVGDGRCDEDCRRNLVFARQTRLSLNKEMERVNRVFLSTDDCCDRAYFDGEHSGLVVLEASEHAALLKLVPPQDREHSVYVVDPLGNLVMRYDSRENPKGLLSDMEKLLKLSHIG